jgi:hypothetical protein
MKIPGAGIKARGVEKENANFRRERGRQFRPLLKEISWGRTRRRRFAARLRARFGLCWSQATLLRSVQAAFSEVTHTPSICIQ